MRLNQHAVTSPDVPGYRALTEMRSLKTDASEHDAGNLFRDWS
jgi:hypothetical protein